MEQRRVKGSVGRARTLAKASGTTIKMYGKTAQMSTATVRHQSIGWLTLLTFSNEEQAYVSLTCCIC